ncbi:hypothetical protein SUGI_0259700 [Cryptomeria japonica]|nr:hypothetical protein SUGI_0259700 [Cryptomeria japonica]
MNCYNRSIRLFLEAIYRGVQIFWRVLFCSDWSWSTRMRRRLQSKNCGNEQLAYCRQRTLQSICWRNLGSEILLEWHKANIVNAAFEEEPEDQVSKEPSKIPVTKSGSDPSSCSETKKVLCEDIQGLSAKFDRKM